MSQEWLSRKEAAQYLGVSADTVDRLATRGTITKYRNPETGMVRLRKSELDDAFQPVLPVGEIRSEALSFR